MIEQPATNKIRIVEKRKKQPRVKKVEQIETAVQNPAPKNKKAEAKTKNHASKNTPQKEEQLSGKVSKVEPRGLTIDLANGEVAFLPKENMHIKKGKKLEDIFSEGFIIRAKIKNKKDGKIVLTQKEDHALKNKESKKEKTQEQPKKNKKTSPKKSKKTQEVTKESPSQKAPQLAKEEKEEKPKQKTLKDLKKLQSIGNMKISVGRGKKSNLTKLAEEKEEVVELPKVPEGLLENIIKTTEAASEKFATLTSELREKNLLHVGVRGDD